MDNVDRIFLTFGICVIQARQAGTVVEHWKVGEGEVAYANSRVSHGRIPRGRPSHACVS